MSLINMKNKSYGTFTGIQSFYQRTTSTNNVLYSGSLTLDALLDTDFATYSGGTITIGISGRYRIHFKSKVNVQAIGSSGSVSYSFEILKNGVTALAEASKTQSGASVLSFVMNFNTMLIYDHATLATIGSAPSGVAGTGIDCWLCYDDEVDLAATDTITFPVSVKKFGATLTGAIFGDTEISIEKVTA